jgi:hypothetical protein
LEVLHRRGAFCTSFQGVQQMSEQNQDEAVPFMQQLLDNPFLLLFIGVMVPMVVYTLWGVLEIMMIPVAK